MNDHILDSSQIDAMLSALAAKAADASDDSSDDDESVRSESDNHEDCCWICGTLVQGTATSETPMMDHIVNGGCRFTARQGHFHKQQQKPSQGELVLLPEDAMMDNDDSKLTAWYGCPQCGKSQGSSWKDCQKHLWACWPDHGEHTVQERQQMCTMWHAGFSLVEEDPDDEKDLTQDRRERPLRTSRSSDGNVSGNASKAGNVANGGRVDNAPQHIVPDNSTKMKYQCPECPQGRAKLHELKTHMKSCCPARVKSYASVRSLQIACAIQGALPNRFACFNCNFAHIDWSACKKHMQTCCPAQLAKFDKGKAKKASQQQLKARRKTAPSGPTDRTDQLQSTPAVVSADNSGPTPSMKVKYKCPQCAFRTMKPDVLQAHIQKCCPDHRQLSESMKGEPARAVDGSGFACFECDFTHQKWNKCKSHMQVCCLDRLEEFTTGPAQKMASKLQYQGRMQQPPIDSSKIQPGENPEYLEGTYGVNYKCPQCGKVHRKIKQLKSHMQKCCLSRFQSFRTPDELKAACEIKVLNQFCCLECRFGNKNWAPCKQHMTTCCKTELESRGTEKQQRQASQKECSRRRTSKLPKKVAAGMGDIVTNDTSTSNHVQEQEVTEVITSSNLQSVVETVQPARSEDKSRSIDPVVNTLQPTSFENAPRFIDQAAETVEPASLEDEPCVVDQVVETIEPASFEEKSRFIHQVAETVEPARFKGLPHLIDRVEPYGTEHAVMTAAEDVDKSEITRAPPILTKETTPVAVGKKEDKCSLM